jgi:molecular chaperone GrpE
VIKKKKSKEEHEEFEDGLDEFDMEGSSEGTPMQDEQRSDDDVSEGPLSPDDELSTLQSELEDIRIKADEYLDGWQRARAEFSNYKKRVQKEREETRTFITAEILAKYLDVVDDFKRALDDQPSDDEIGAWAEGIDMIYRKLKAILEAEGVEEISAEGEAFDPNFHEAITFEESDDHNEGEVLGVVQPGYQIGNRIIRPAKVRVAK